MTKHVTKRDELGHTWHFYQAKIDALKNSLSLTDYKTIKYLEGQLSEEAFQAHVASRQSIRAQIAEYEGKVESLKDDF